MAWRRAAIAWAVVSVVGACASEGSRARTTPASGTAEPTSATSATPADDPAEVEPPQTFAEAMRIICVDAHEAGAAAATPEERTHATARYIADHLRNGRVVNEFLVLPELSPDERRARILALSEEAGLESCPTAEPDMPEPDGTEPDTASPEPPAPPAEETAE